MKKQKQKQQLKLGSAFDALAEVYEKLEKEISQQKDELKAKEAKKNMIEDELREAIDKGEEGKEYGHIIEQGRRRIGKVDKDRLKKLKDIDPGFIKKVPGKVEVRCYDEKTASKLEREMLEKGLTPLRTDPELKPHSLTDIEKLFKDRPELNRYRKEVLDLLNIHAKEILKVYRK